MVTEEDITIERETKIEQLITGIAMMMEQTLENEKCEVIGLSSAGIICYNVIQICNAYLIYKYISYTNSNLQPM